MKGYFSIGELSKYQNISKQTLIFYDKIGLFRPAYVDPQNGYRYYSAKQIDYLDTILIMKKIGFPLSQIREHMEHYNTAGSLSAVARFREVPFAQFFWSADNLDAEEWDARDLSQQGASVSEKCFAAALETGKRLRQHFGRS